MNIKSKLPFVGLLLLVAGCANSPIGPGAGAAQAVVKGTVNDVNQRAQAVFQKMNIQVTGSSTKNSGNELQLTGKMGDKDVTVIMDNAPNSTTNVEVDAGKNMINGDRDLAKEVLSEIVQRG